jgi:hypothetical protein
MIKHIVMFRFSETDDKRKFLSDLKIRIEKLNDLPHVFHIEAGINFSNRDSAFDIALNSDFENTQKLEAYKVHPQHVELVNYLKKFPHETVVCDYEL